MMKGEVPKVPMREAMAGELDKSCSLGAEGEFGELFSSTLGTSSAW